MGANVPSGVLVAAFPEPFFRLIDPVAHILLLTSLTLFWTVFILDKIASNEPWERTTLYYWKVLAILLLASLTCLLGLLCLTLPALTNPFSSHWHAGLTTIASLAFTFLSLLSPNPSSVSSTLSPTSSSSPPLCFSGLSSFSTRLHQTTLGSGQHSTTGKCCPPSCQVALWLICQSLTVPVVPPLLAPNCPIIAT